MTKEEQIIKLKPTTTSVEPEVIVDPVAASLRKPKKSLVPPTDYVEHEGIDDSVEPEVEAPEVQPTKTKKRKLVPPTTYVDDEEEGETIEVNEPSGQYRGTTADVSGSSNGSVVVNQVNTTEGTLQFADAEPTRVDHLIDENSPLAAQMRQARQEPQKGDIFYYVEERGRRIKRVLTREIEEILIKTANDLDIDIRKRKIAFTMLLQAYDKYIKHLVYKDYKYSNVPEEDLAQAASEGFVEAVKNYDPKKSNGARLITYAYHHIKKNISKLINQIGYATKTITTKDASLAKTAILRIRAERDLTNDDYEEIAKRLNNKTASYVRSIEGALVKATPFETSSSTNDGDRPEFNPAATMYDERANFAEAVEEDEFSQKLRIAFFHAFETELDEREQYIIKCRVAEDFFPEVKEKSTLADIAAKFGISNERVRQIENKAKLKLQNALKDFDPNNY